MCDQRQRSFALLGFPLGHTMSPPIHQRLFALSGKSGSYNLLELPLEQLESRIPELFACTGFNITIPHKLNIIPYLDLLSPTAQRYGSVNTVLCDDGTGKSVGYNTDVDGFLRSVETLGADLSRPVMVVGAGGAGRMFAIESALHGAAVTLAVRTVKPQTEKLREDILSAVPGAQVTITTLDRLPDTNFELLVNATPVGMYPHPGVSPVPASFLRQVRCVFDAVYNPTETQLLLDAQAAGCKAVGGMSMLVWQAVVAHEIWDHVHYTPEQIGGIIQEMTRIVDEKFGVPARQNPDGRTDTP